MTTLVFSATSNFRSTLLLLLVLFGTVVAVAKDSVGGVSSRRVPRLERGLGGAAHTLDRELFKMMKMMDCHGKMMKRHKGTEDCSTLVPTKRPVNKPPTPRPNTKPGGKKPTKPPSIMPRHIPSADPASHPSSRPSNKPTDFCFDDTVLFGGSNGNGHRYYAHSVALSYQEALDLAEELMVCCGMSPHLVTYTDSAEEAFVWNSVVDPTYSSVWWSGLNDQDNNNVYTWVTGEQLLYRSGEVTGIGPGYCMASFRLYWYAITCGASGNQRPVYEYDCPQGF